jgi:ferric iron reductase protein FhuF
LKFKARTDENRELLAKWDLVAAYVSRYKPHTVFDIEIVRRQKTESSPLRKYYFACVMPPLVEKTGYEKHETLLVHHQMKVTYFKDDPNYEIYQDKRGIWRNVPSVFSKDSKIKVSIKKEFVDWAIRLAAQYGAYIEDPKK